MAEKDKKYYWLKLKRDFFKRHDIQIIEDMPNGKDYILFYMKLLCESVDHEGNLRFSDEIPYNEQMLATITRTNVDIVRSAVKIFTQLKMMEVLDDGTFYMKEVEKLIGSETYWAERKRLQREENKLLTNELSEIGHCPICPGKSIEIDIDKEKEIYKEKEKAQRLNDIEFSQENYEEKEKKYSTPRKKEKEVGEVREVFEYWNTKKIIKHSELTADRVKAISKGLGTYGLDKVKECIDRYSTMLDDENYYYSYKWTIEQFFNRKEGISEFTDEGGKWVNYLSQRKITKKEESGYEYL